MGRPRTHPLSLMSRDEIIAYVRELFAKDGPATLTFQALKKAGVYFHLNHKGIKHRELVAAVGGTHAYDEFKASNFTTQTKTMLKRRWTWNRVLEDARKAIEAHGHLPPAQWFQQNGQGALVAYVYSSGRTWETLRAEVDCFVTSDFVESRNGMRWRSHPEASLSNFLYARGIRHKVGERYPEGIADMSDMTFAYFDLHFVNQSGSWTDVEVWGDKPNGHAEQEYARKRGIKESFNRANPNFFGIQYEDCFDESKLTEILIPHIGTIAPFIFDKPTDKVIHSTHWSNADELLEHCREIAELQPDKIFPSESWLRKRRGDTGRDGRTYNTLAIYIRKWLGGVRKLREILGQSKHSTVLWDEAKVAEHYLAFTKEHGVTPSQAKSRERRKKLSSDVLLYAQNICHAAEVYAGGVRKLNVQLGIQLDRKRKWSKDKILDGFRMLHGRYGLFPNQIVGASSAYREIFKLTEEDYALAKNLSAMAPAHFGKTSEVHKLLGIKTTDIRVVAKQRGPTG